MDPLRYPVIIPVPSWYHDHAVGGRTVMPAVEIMLLLAAEAGKNRPGIRLGEMRQARFARFLEIPPAAPHLELFVELSGREGNRMRASLLSRRRLPAMTRLLEHARVEFSYSGAALRPGPRPGIRPEGQAERAVPAATVYRQHVPFGPAYQTLRDRLHLNGREAWGRMQAPRPPDDQGPAHALGSPFPLDAAFHAACVHGQQHVDFVPFPVGFSRRIIHRPTRPGQGYLVRAVLAGCSGGRLFYDLVIADMEGSCRETVLGVEMRRVL